MGFIFGLMIGAMAASGGNTLPPLLGNIPFRCLAAFETSDADYRQCRTVSLRRELWEGTGCGHREMRDPADPCSFDKAITWEIAGLREMRRAMQQRPTTPPQAQ
jgi:hypothetical protein